ncbi:MAG: tetratricopeptide repeat protein, partial [Gemmatimonadota bacterium]
MTDAHRALQPLDESEAAIARLQDYQSTAELASALPAIHAAVQRSLRFLLRADKRVADDLRLSALSPTELAPDRLIAALRQRDLISLDLAHQIHELGQAAGRAETGSVHAADADQAMRVIDQLRTEIRALGERHVREIAHNAVAAGALDKVHEVPPPRAPRQRKPLLIVLAVLLVLAVIGWLVLRDSPTERGIALMREGNSTEAERLLAEAVEEDPGNAIAAYYLAALYRRSQRYDEAGRV